MDTAGDVPDLSLPNIKQRLHDGNFPDCEAEILGEYLSIPSGIIKTFKHDCGSDSERLLSKLINHWLNNDSKKSWSRLADAIECCRYGVLAWNLRSMSERPLLSISEKQQSEDEENAKSESNGRSEQLEFQKPTIMITKSSLSETDGIVEEGDFSPPEKEEDEQLNGECDDRESSIKSFEWSGSFSETKTDRPDFVTIMVAGRARNGKTTALNNIFGLNLTARASATSVTQTVDAIRVTKKIASNEEGSLHDEVTLQVIDTPGLGALDIHKEDIVKDLKKVTKDINYTLIYCFSVSPNTALTETDKAIIENLHLALGKDIWSKCVLLFTFSDHARLEFEDSLEEYREHIKNHAIEFQKLLKSISSKLPTVKTIFEYDSPEELEQEQRPPGIIAIPVKKKTTGSEDILPKMIKNGQDWTDVVFIELMKRTDEMERKPFSLFKYFTPHGATLGAATGAGIGAAIGVVGGPIGIAAGMSAGAAVGAAVGGTKMLTVKKRLSKSVSTLVNLIKKK